MKRRDFKILNPGGSDNSPYWAVNIGTLAVPTLSVVDGVISGKTTGVAAILDRQADGRPKVTDRRESFERYSDGDEIADGTLIQLDNVSGKITIVFANCEPTPGLQGLELEPES